MFLRVIFIQFYNISATSLFSVGQVNLFKIHFVYETCNSHTNYLFSYFSEFMVCWPLLLFQIKNCVLCSCVETLCLLYVVLLRFLALGMAQASKKL